MDGNKRPTEDNNPYPYVGIFEIYICTKFISSTPTDETAYRDKQAYKYVKAVLPYSLYLGTIMARIHRFGCISTKDTKTSIAVHNELLDEFIQSHGL